MADKKDNQQLTFQYTELVIYGVLFLLLVAAVFVLNINLSNESRRDTEQIFCATKQQEYWGRAYRNLLKTQTTLAEYELVSDDSTQLALAEQKRAIIDTSFRLYRRSIEIFDGTVKALDKGGKIMLEGAEYEIESVKDDRARKYILDIANRWYPRADSLIGIAHQYEGTRKLNSDMLLAAIDFAVQNDELILTDNRDFIVKLGELAAERQTRLQTIQVIALIASIVVFIVMAVRLTISLRKQAKIIQESQGQLVQSEKMASLGQMVAGLAHEMNTPLGFVRNNVEIIRENEKELQAAFSSASAVLKDLVKGNYAEVEKTIPETIKKLDELEKIGVVDENNMMLESALQGIDRIQELIVNLKNFSRLDQSMMQSANVNECLDSTLVIANHILKRHVTVHKEYAQLPNILCAPAQLNQVFLNLITNAAHAMEKKGQGNLWIKTYMSSKAAEVVVQISDDGTGIPKEIINKIFDPFFTTKPVGQGTGMGLSISKKIIEEGHKGRIEVKSTVGKGTDFFIYLPMKTEIKEEKVFENVPALN
ncbi:MAG: sensor histidine kinase [Candidatus Thermochlorobacter sp.]